jgi:hypothetical protein
MRSFDVVKKDNKKETKSEGLPDFLSDYSIMFTVKNIGAAFPLALDGNLQMQRSRGHSSAHVRAFLFSIKSVIFGIERNGSKGLFTMQSFSFQFVDR